MHCSFAHITFMVYGYCIVKKIWWQSIVHISCFKHAFRETPLSFTTRISRLIECVLCEKQGIIFCKGKMICIRLTIKLTMPNSFSDLSWQWIKINHKNIKKCVIISSLNLLYKPIMSSFSKYLTYKKNTTSCQAFYCFLYEIRNLFKLLKHWNKFFRFLVYYSWNSVYDLHPSFYK